MCGAAAYLAESTGVKGADGAQSASARRRLAVCGRRDLPADHGAVSYYYVMPTAKPDFTKLKGPCLGHFGTADAFIPLETARSSSRDPRGRR